MRLFAKKEETAEETVDPLAETKAAILKRAELWDSAYSCYLESMSCELDNMKPEDIAARCAKLADLRLSEFHARFPEDL